MLPLLHETFSTPQLHPGLIWFCEPQQWSAGGDAPGLLLRPDEATDFWQRTHYGFVADNGHFLCAMVAGNARVETRVRFRGVHQYDQAGLMLRFTPDCWLKTSVEFEPEAPNRLGAVVTRAGYSDWSTQDIDEAYDEFVFRVTRTGGDCLVEASVGNGPFTQIRLTHLDGGAADASGYEAPAYVGLYACSPKGSGFEAHFSYLHIDGLGE